MPRCGYNFLWAASDTCITTIFTALGKPVPSTPPAQCLQQEDQPSLPSPHAACSLCGYGQAGVSGAHAPAFTPLQFLTLLLHRAWDRLLATPSLLRAGRNLCFQPLNSLSGLEPQRAARHGQLSSSTGMSYATSNASITWCSWFKQMLGYRAALNFLQILH